jgi:hypothetical protein
VPPRSRNYCRAIGSDVEVTAAENRRLQKEVRQLRARIAAFESSRWWRPHPRLVLRRLRLRITPYGLAGEELETPRDTGPAFGASDPLTARFRTDVFAHGSFSRDWFTRNIPTWEPILGDLDRHRPRILELGSFEGLSACFFLWRLPDAQVTCVDNFIGAPEYLAYGDAVVEDTFDRNVALVDATRVRKLVGDTGQVLLDLVEEQETFDVVYVDASHRALDVMVDACLSWNLLALGGIVIFDDYDWI